MKIIYALFLFCSLLLFSCSKKNDNNCMPTPAAEGLTGTWKWIKTDGGIGNNIHDTPASTGKHIELRFTNAGGYTIYTNGALTSQGTYSLSTGSCIHDGSGKTIVDLSVVTDQDMMIERLDNTALETSDNVYDGTVSLYSKQ